MVSSSLAGQLWAAFSDIEGYSILNKILKRYLGHLKAVVFGLIYFLLGLQVIFAGHCPSVLESSSAFFMGMNYFVPGMSMQNTQRQQSGSKTFQNSFTE